MPYPLTPPDPPTPAHKPPDPEAIAGQLAGQPEAFYRLGGETCRSLVITLANTPGGALPRNPVGSIPARSNASRTTQQHPPLGVHRGPRLAPPFGRRRGAEVAVTLSTAAGAGVARTRGVGVGVTRPGPTAVRRGIRVSLRPWISMSCHVVRGIDPAAGASGTGPIDRDWTPLGRYRGCKA